MLITKNIEIKWNSKHIEYYTSKGYVFTKVNDKFIIDTKDAPPNCKNLVYFKCDVCGSISKRPVGLYWSQKVGNLDYCPNCTYIKKDILKRQKIENLNKLNEYRKLLSGEINNFPDGFWKYATKDEVKMILEYFVERLLEDQIISSKKEFPQVFSQSLLQKYKLISIIKCYNIEQIINIVFPNHNWKPWEFKSVVDGFWDKEENIQEAFNWLLDRLYADGIINNEEDILKLDTRTILTKYHLYSLLYVKFNSSPYQFWNYFFPNKWCEWEFHTTPKFYWTSSEKRINALKELCEKICDSIDEIPSIITYPYLVKYYTKFAGVCDDHYKSNLYLWINEVYPNRFTPEDFKQVIASDGTKLDSQDEKIIHEWLITNFNKVKYYDNNIILENKWYNDIENEEYVADWLIDDLIIIEYFGWYTPINYGKYKKFTDYIDKADRKMKYFNDLYNYKFIALFPSDLKNNLKGLKDKFKKYITISA